MSGTAARARAAAVAAAVALAGAGCPGRTAATDSAAPASDSSAACTGETVACTLGCCPCPAAGAPAALPLGTGAGVALVDAGDLDGDGRLDLVLAPAAGGVAAFLARGCGALVPGATALGAGAVTGLAVADLDGAGGADVAALDAGKVLSALGGDALVPLWSATLDALPSAGAVVRAHLDTDADDDVAAFDATNGSLLRVENTGSAWMVRTMVALPPGIAMVRAGDLGGPARDELFFIGAGLVEVVSVADFDFSDVRFLSSAAHAGAAFVDWDQDGDGDALLGAGGAVEPWIGDGATALTTGTALDLGAGVTDVAPFGGAATGAGGVAALDAMGRLTLLRRGPAGAPEQAAQMPAAAALRVFAGDVDGDATDDVVAVTSAGEAWVWRLP